MNPSSHKPHSTHSLRPLLVTVTTFCDQVLLATLLSLCLRTDHTRFAEAAGTASEEPSPRHPQPQEAVMAGTPGPHHSPPKTSIRVEPIPRVRLDGIDSLEKFAQVKLESEIPFYINCISPTVDLNEIPNSERLEFSLNLFFLQSESQVFVIGSTPTSMAILRRSRRTH